LLKSHGDDSRKIDRFSALLVRQFAEGEVAPHPHQMAAAANNLQQSWRFGGEPPKAF